MGKGSARRRRGAGRRRSRNAPGKGVTETGLPSGERADAVAMNVAPQRVARLRADTARAAAALAAHATSAVAAQHRAGRDATPAASAAVAAGTDRAGRWAAAAGGTPDDEAVAGAASAQQGLQGLDTGEPAPTDDTAAVDSSDPIVQAARQWTVIG